MASSTSNNQFITARNTYAYPNGYMIYSTSLTVEGCVKLCLSYNFFFAGLSRGYESKNKILKNLKIIK